MRTDNLPTNISQASGLSAKVQDLNLSNQLFGTGDSAQAFDRILSSQVQSGREAPQSRSNTERTDSAQEANSRREGGNRLPEDDRRLKQKQREAQDERASRAAEHRDSRAEQSKAQAQEARDSQQREEQASARAADSDDRLANQQNEAKQQDKAVAEEAVESDQVLTEESPDTVKPAAVDASTTESPEPEVVAVVEDGTPNLSPEDSESETGDAASDIVISPELLKSNPEDADPELTDKSDSVDGEILAELSKEEQQALAEAAAASVNVEGEGFAGTPDSAELTDAATASIAGVTAKGTQVDAEAPIATTADEFKKAAPAVSSANLAASTGVAGKAESETNSKHTQPQIQPALDADETALTGSSSDKKPDVAMLADKLAIRNSIPEAVVPTPVQERLAALAKALDKAAGTSKDASPPATKAIEHADGSKATPFQRSLEQMGRSPATLAKPFAPPIQTPMQSREWGNEVGQRLMMMVSSKLNSAQIQLNPRDLGPIDVRVSVQQDQANVVFTSHAAPTRDALEQALPRLREMMEHNGVALGDVDVRDQNAQESHERRGQDQRRGSDSAAEAEAVAQSESADVQGQQAIGLVDYYA